MMGPDYKNNLDVKTKHELWFSTEDPTMKILTLSPSPYSKYLYSEHDKLKSLLRSLLSIPTIWCQNLVPEFLPDEKMTKRTEVWPIADNGGAKPRPRGDGGLCTLVHHTRQPFMSPIKFIWHPRLDILSGMDTSPLVTNTATATAWTNVAHLSSSESAAASALLWPGSWTCGWGGGEYSSAFYLSLPSSWWEHKYWILQIKLYQ